MCYKNPALVLPGLIVAVGLAGAGLGRTGGHALTAQQAECSVGTDTPCREVRTCHRREWRWFYFGGLGLVPVRVCVESSTEFSYFRQLGGGSGSPSDGEPEADLPDGDHTG